MKTLLNADSELKDLNGEYLAILSLVIHKYGQDDGKGGKVMSISLEEFLEFSRNNPELFIYDDAKDKVTMYKVVSHGG